jgi:hypothetical protein
MSINTENLGGMLIYRFWPRVHVYVVERISFCCEDFLSKSYFEVLWHGDLRPQAQNQWPGQRAESASNIGVLDVTAPGISACVPTG